MRLCSTELHVVSKKMSWRTDLKYPTAGARIWGALISLKYKDTSFIKDWLLHDTSISFKNLSLHLKLLPKASKRQTAFCPFPPIQFPLMFAVYFEEVAISLPERGSQRVNAEGTQENGLHPAFISRMETRKLSAVKSFWKEPESERTWEVQRFTHSRPENGRNTPRTQGQGRETALTLVELWVTSCKHPSELAPYRRAFQCTWIIPQFKIQLFHKGISNENSKSK